MTICRKHSVFYFPCCILFFLFCSLLALRSNGQSVAADFTDPLLIENFDNNNSEWPIFTNRDNFFIIQSGEYLLERKNAESQYVIFNSTPKEPEAYEASTAVKVEKGYAGLIFKVQRSGQGAFMIEISESRKYRIKQLTGANYQLLTGELSTEGWIRHSSLKNTYNTILIKSARNKTDIYLNGNYITTLSDQSYTNGTIGLTIGPQSKARIDHFNILREKAPEAAFGEKDNVRSDSLKLLNSVLKSNQRIIEKLSRENDSLKNENSHFKLRIEELQKVQSPSPDLSPSAPLKDSLPGSPVTPQDTIKPKSN